MKAAPIRRKTLKSMNPYHRLDPRPALFILLGIAALATHPPLAAAPVRWSLVETSEASGARMAPQSQAASVLPSAPILALNPSLRYQTMVGFGGALTESSGWVLSQITPERRAEVLRRYYDPVDGIGYTLARTHMNSCDFSLNMWALDEVPGDYDLHHFSLAPMRAWVLPLLKEASEAAGPGRFKLLVSPWSPPAWMKTNNRMDDGGSLRQEYAPVWANYFARFAHALIDETGIPVWAFTVQNEPEAHQTWESCIFTPEQEEAFVRDHLGPALRGSGLGNVKLIGWDHNRDRLEARASALLGDKESAQYLWGLGIHWYVSDDFAASSRVHAAHPDKPIVFTEGCFEGGKGQGSWAHGEGYASQVMGDIQNWVCGFFDWNIALDQRGGPNHVGNFCDAPVIVNTETKQVTYSPAFYFIGQFSKFVLPGSQRIASAGGPAGLRQVAFLNPDGSIVAVVLNSSDTAEEFRISLEGSELPCRIPAHAIQTYVGAH